MESAVIVVVLPAAFVSIFGISPGVDGIIFGISPTSSDLPLKFSVADSFISVSCSAVFTSSIMIIIPTFVLLNKTLSVLDLVYKGDIQLRTELSFICSNFSFISCNSCSSPSSAVISISRRGEIGGVFVLFSSREKFGCFVMRSSKLPPFGLVCSFEGETKFSGPRSFFFFLRRNNVIKTTKEITAQPPTTKIHEVDCSPTKRESL
mmetsp:Transcript_57351/g.69008  ORF Transcript_57351/g.69008 Transcript_57351/m.69008 type:complete len:206 (-) Transcript_57351:128-745(-)